MTRISSEEAPCRPKGTTFHSNWPSSGQLRPKARLPPVRGPHPQQMITTGQIELGEKAGSPRAVEQRVDVRERLDRRARDRVEAPVVVADAPRAVGRASAGRRSICSRAGPDRRLTST